MASNTTRLGLMKKDPVVDGNDTFNIKMMLNDNWDAIDEKVALKSDGVPSGIITMWSGTYATIPTGWNLCNGTNGTPDLRDRFILGATVESDIGVTGGQHSVALTVDQMPSHNHTGTISTDGSHTHTVTDAYVADTSAGGYNGGTGGDPNTSTTRTTSSAGSHTHTVTVNSTGGGQAHENRPAFYKLAYIMKA